MFTLWLEYSLIEIYDNFLPDDFADEIENLLMDYQFNWYVNPTTAYADDNSNKDKLDKVQTKNTIEHSQLVHIFHVQKNDGRDGVENSEYCNIIHRIMDIVKTNTSWKDNPILIRSKANLNFPITNYTKDNHQPVHSDIFGYTEHEYKSLLYYVNDSDGDTMFFDNKLNVTTRVSPKKNRVIIFDSINLHAGSNPIENHMRAVINLIFKWR